jgi:hypothetical protein
MLCGLIVTDSLVDLLAQPLASLSDPQRSGCPDGHDHGKRSPANKEPPPPRHRTDPHRPHVYWWELIFGPVPDGR